MRRDAGIATIYAKRETAEAGLMPAPVWDTVKATSYYASRTVGMARYWTAQGHNDQVDLLIRIDRNAAISTRDRVILSPFTIETPGGWYKILQVQHITDEDGLLATELSLERLDDLDPEDDA